MAYPRGNLKPEHPEQGGGKRDTFTETSGIVTVAKVMAKAEAAHDKGGDAQNWRLGTNQAKHVSGDDNKGGFGE